MQDESFSISEMLVLRRLSSVPAFCRPKSSRAVLAATTSLDTESCDKRPSACVTDDQRDESADVQFLLQHGIGFEANGVAIAFFLKQAVQCRLGKGRVTAKELRNVQVAIPLDHWQQHPPPEFSTGVVATPQQGPLQVAELVEQKQRMVAEALEVPVVGCALLLSVGFADLQALIDAWSSQAEAIKRKMTGVKWFEGEEEGKS